LRRTPIPLTSELHQVPRAEPPAELEAAAAAHRPRADQVARLEILAFRPSGQWRLDSVLSKRRLTLTRQDRLLADNRPLGLVRGGADLLGDPHRTQRLDQLCRAQ
jgi:hypothetical protein